MKLSPSLNGAAGDNTGGRPRVDGKFLCVNGERFLIKGATYGTFAPDATGQQFPSPDRVSNDLELMARHGLNTVRTYTLPPPSLLDEAARHGLRVMAGVPWAQHVAFLDDRRMCREIRSQVAAQVRAIADHPALLMIALGNEIPASVVRWHGRTRTERFLRELYQDSKTTAPETLFTYVNYPPTEYLDLPFLDLVAFNVYLHREADMRSYVARLHLLAGNKPLLLAELGSDSIRQGESEQAALTAMQVSAAFREGACGAVAFAWTDEWWRGGFTVEDWAFGLVDANRVPKPALHRVARVFAEAPFAPEEQQHWPKVSVVVCAYNAADTIDECLASLGRLKYPDFEVVVINDGSKDGTGDIARRHAFAKVIDTPNGGLCVARNMGLDHSTGSIVAYTDADVHVGEDWLTYLVQPFLTSDVVGSGGPNVVPADDPWMAQCIARAPGAPTHVLLDNRIAEHVPGCNMAFRRDVLIEIGGFNPIYLRAGDDVDLCWRLQARGWKIGFAPAALVWHHHRASVRAYWKQQAGYGEGEQWLMPHHPDRFRDGQAIWRGHIYSPLPFIRGLSKAQVNTGQWGTAPFPSVYLRDAYPFAFMPHKVRWLFTALALGVAGVVFESARIGNIGKLFLLISIIALLTTLVKCVVLAIESDISTLPRVGGMPHWLSRMAYRFMIALLHFVQPFARAYGRVRGMLANVDLPTPEPVRHGAERPSPREIAGAVGTAFGVGPARRFWGETWTDAPTVLASIRDRLQQARSTRAVKLDDGWQMSRDISVQLGRWTWMDLRVLIEDHGSGKGLARVDRRVRMVPSGLVRVLVTAATLVGVVSIVAITQSPESYVPYIIPSAILLAAGRWTTRTVSKIIATERCIVDAMAARDLYPVGGPAAVPMPEGLVGSPVKKTSP
jgi:GT2 family glycosyltransferase